MKDLTRLKCLLACLIFMRHSASSMRIIIERDLSVLLNLGMELVNECRKASNPHILIYILLHFALSASE